MSRRKALFISPVIPAAHRSGGQLAVYNHLSSLAAACDELELDLVAADAAGSGEPIPGEFSCFRSKVLARGTPPGRSLSALTRWVTDIRPWAAATLPSAESRRWMARLLSTHRYDVIVVDHADAFSLLQGHRADAPLTYIAHNVEADIVRDRLSFSPPGSPERLHLWVEWQKTRHYEKQLLARADRVICISDFDRRTLADRVAADKLVSWPELPLPKAIPPRSWDGMRMLFVGTAGHVPNLEAVRWMVSQLMPALARLCPDARLHVAGCSAADVADLALPANVVFEGFVSAQGLEELHARTDLFVCPVVLGSGIKMKALEAAAYGLPVAATAESLRGIGFLDGCSLPIDRDTEAGATRIAAALRNPALLADLGRRALSALALQRAQRPRLADVI